MSTQIKCVILDDEIPGLTYLKMLCSQFSEIEVVRAFNDSNTFLEEINNLDFDLCILDIEMGGLNGLQVANILKDKAIIFVTAYKEYAVEAFELNAVDYICKPIQRDRLKQAIDKAVERLAKRAKEKDFVQLNSDKGKVLLYFDRIDYISVSESDSRDKTVHLSDGRTLLLKNISLAKLQEVLPFHSFCQINKKEIIALRVVQYFSNDEITATILNAGAPVVFTLSEIYKSNFLEKLTSLS